MTSDRTLATAGVAALTLALAGEQGAWSDAA